MDLIRRFLHGIRDSIVGIAAIWRRKDSERKRRALSCLQKCCVLNGGFLATVLFIRNGLLLPITSTVNGYLLSQLTYSHIWPVYHLVIEVLFTFTYILPLFIVCKVANVNWFQGIADNSFKGQQKGMNVSKFIADNLFNFAIEALFLFQSHLVSYLPIGPFQLIFTLLHFSLLNSLYSFEYPWFLNGWELFRRLEVIESNWPYYLGFGLPLAIITSFPTSIFLSGCLFAIFFPLFIFSANEAKPDRNSCSIPIRFFKVSMWASTTVGPVGCKICTSTFQGIVKVYNMYMQ